MACTARDLDLRSGWVKEEGRKEKKRKRERERLGQVDYYVYRPGKSLVDAYLDRYLLHAAITGAVSWLRGNHSTTMECHGGT
jgi:hypothetical protein